MILTKLKQNDAVAQVITSSWNLLGGSSRKTIASSTSLGKGDVKNSHCKWLRFQASLCIMNISAFSIGGTSLFTISSRSWTRSIISLCPLASDLSCCATQRQHQEKHSTRPARAQSIGLGPVTGVKKHLNVTRRSVKACWAPAACSVWQLQECGRASLPTQPSWDATTACACRQQAVFGCALWCCQFVLGMHIAQCKNFCCVWVQANCLRVLLSESCLCALAAHGSRYNCPVSQAGVYDAFVKNEVVLFTKKASNMTNPASFVDHRQCMDVVGTSDQPAYGLTRRWCHKVVSIFLSYKMKSHHATKGSHVHVCEELDAALKRFNETIYFTLCIVQVRTGSSRCRDAQCPMQRLRAVMPWPNSYTCTPTQRQDEGCKEKAYMQSSFSASDKFPMTNVCCWAESAHAPQKNKCIAHD